MVSPPCYATELPRSPAHHFTCLVVEAHVRLAAQLVVVDGRVQRGRRLVRYEAAGLEQIIKVRGHP